MKFPAGKYLAHRALRRMEWMIYADERRGFRHAIPLHHGISDALEECFRFARERRAAGNKRPELPAQLPVQPAKTPNAPKKRLALGGGVSRGEPGAPAARIHFLLQSISQSVQH